MAAITVSEIRPVELIEQFTGIAGEALTKGQPVRFDTNGRLVRAAADTATNANVVGIALRDAAAGTAATCVRYGVLDLGNALNALAYGAAVYLGNTAGTLDTAAGTVSVTVGQVIAHHTLAGPQKLLRVHIE
ncbi:DUF2190 family protein (plasmid) [Thermomicrobium sp. 4228-Ro]|uniref:capsid cement protein n=1 Tax=Thermomicrobium sp. 4228-Ro TaxID=2993937 RepID=UPI002248F18C|nr:capsid cement protein [Thermomicrobium sp. 4228-Ro]MCX2728547.1 DUF2190 family protein [Thermomicrobium sp. 4228-Ro]